MRTSASSVLDVIKRRRTARLYAETGVPRDLIDHLLEAVRWAPSAGNRQPWELIVIEARETKDRLRDAFLAEADLHDAAYRAVSRKQADLLLAPVLIVVCGRPAMKERFVNAASISPSAKDDLFLLTMGAAIQNLLLAATSLGLSTTWMARPARIPATAEILHIPPDVQVIAVVAVGYSTEEPSFGEHLRVDIASRTHVGHFGRRPSNDGA